MKITVVGTGYVGLSIATLLSQKHDVVSFDIDNERVEKINLKISPIVDDEISFYFKSKQLNLVATIDKEFAYKEADYIIIAAPTNYDEQLNFFDTSKVENVIFDILSFNNKALIIIKSTIPVGYVESIRKKMNYENIIFSPEFLREGKALFDNLYPSRIVIGEVSERAENVAKLLLECSLKPQTEILLTNPTEAEAIKLFSNTFLALRVSYFNELDSYAIVNGLDSKQIITGVCLDPRIGEHYNNPSFGYGGYCLPKDTKQLLANFQNVPQNLIKAIVESNDTRKKFISKEIINKNPKVVGIYRLTMKKDSDNFRESSVQSIMEELRVNGVECIIYEPVIKDANIFKGYKVINNIDEFKRISDVVITNRYDDELSDVINKVYTRDIFSRD